MKTSEKLLKAFKEFRPHLTGHDSSMDLFLEAIEEVNKMEPFYSMDGNKGVFRNSQTNRRAIILSKIAAGMCDKTIGMTLVVYRYEGDNRDHPFIMEQKCFYEYHYEELS